MNLRLSMRNIFKFAATTGSVLTMIFSPVAQGYQADQTLKKQVEAYMTEMQLDKRVTYKEFWEKTKHLYSGQVYKDVERYLMQSPNELMPEMTLKESVSTSGEKIPTITISEKGKSYNIQIFGEKNKFAKFNNVVLTENDLMLIAPAMRRLTASDIKIKKAHDQNLIIETKKNFTATPTITREMWKKLTPLQRAQFMMNMRVLWSGARDVLEVKEVTDARKIKSKGKKTSALEDAVLTPLQKWNNFFAMLNNAEAADTKCVVAGYIGAYAKNSSGKVSCQYPQGEVSSSCQFPCNPAIYGFADGGAKHCLGNVQELQTATHYNTGCDAKMPLTASELPLPAQANAKKDKSRYEGIVDINRNIALKEVGILDKTKAYLASVLQGDAELAKAFKDGEMSDALLKKLTDIQGAFDRDIAKARTECAEAADEKSQYDKNFWGACDQLHKRFLFVAEFLSAKPPFGCPDGKPVNATTLKCSCEGGTEALPGKACKPVDQGTTVSGTATTSGGAVVSQGTEVRVVCPDGSSQQGDKCICSETNKEPSGNPKKCKDGFNWKPWLIGAGVLATAGLLWFLLKKKKKTDPPPQGCQLTCSNGLILNPASCTCDAVVIDPVCIAPKVLANGICQCPLTNACTPGQQVYNLNTCQCDDVVQQGICPDGVTPYYTPPGPSTCPSPTLCQDGSQVYPPNTCPTEGGSGDNSCDDCNGGVPTGN